jgi:alpha-L-rhamnosidase
MKNIPFFFITCLRIAPVSNINWRTWRGRLSGCRGYRRARNGAEGYCPVAYLPSEACFVPRGGITALIVAIIGGLSLVLAGISVQDLKTENMTEPLGFDVVKPHFSWVLNSTDRGQVQTAYRIIVASSQAGGDAGSGDIWDTQKQNSSTSIEVPYGGSMLQAKKRYWWKVMVWDKDGQTSAWSAASLFEMGPLARSDWGGQWIGGDGTGTEAPYLRKEFSVDAGKTVASARLYINACAYYLAWLNGSRIGDHELDPGFTMYNKTNLFVTHDITSMVKAGTNCIGAELGKGFYDMTLRNDWNFENAPWKGEPRMLAQIDIRYTDGSVSTVVSDGSWKATDGPRTDDCLFTGDTYDARLEKPGWNTVGYNDASWVNARVLAAPTGALKAQMIPPIKIVATIDPVSVTSPAAGIFVFRFPINTVGWGVLSASAPAGTKVKINAGEQLSEDGRVVMGYSDNELQYDYYTFKGSGVETWEPSFTYHGYQYIEVSNFPGTLTIKNMRGRIVHTALDSVGAFTCSNNLLNTIHTMTRRTVLNNVHSIPTDCPTFEKMGWTGDARIMMETDMYNFDMNRFYAKWLNDGRDEQRPSGQVFSIWPMSEGGCCGDDPEWSCAIIHGPHAMWRYYGDTKTMSEFYPNMKAYQNFIKSETGGGYGDWSASEPNSPDLSGDATQCWTLRMMIEMAGELGHTEDVTTWANDLQGKTSYFNNKYWDNANGYYQAGGGVHQANQLIPMMYGVLSDSSRQIPALIAALVNHIDNDCNGYNLCGIIGNKAFWPALTDYGYGDRAYAAANKTGDPSFGYIISQGATTLWEGLSGARSHNHAFFGTIDQWFYEYLAGLKPAAPGFKRISVKPYILGDLTSASGSVKTVHGLLESKWNVGTNGVLSMEVTIPCNTTADISIPKRNYNTNWVLREGGRLCWQNGSYQSGVSGITGGKDDGSHIILAAASGTYRFQAGPSDFLQVLSQKRVDVGLVQFSHNPLSGLTIVRYQVTGEMGSHGHISLLIYDPFGRTVAEVVNADLKPGTYSTVWKGRQDNGKPLAAGTYFLRMQPGMGGNSARRIMLLGE